MGRLIKHENSKYICQVNLLLYVHVNVENVDNNVNKIFHKIVSNVTQPSLFSRYYPVMQRELHRVPKKSTFLFVK